MIKSNVLMTVFAFSALSCAIAWGVDFNVTVVEASGGKSLFVADPGETVAY